MEPTAHGDQRTMLEIYPQQLLKGAMCRTRHTGKPSFPTTTLLRHRSDRSKPCAVSIRRFLAEKLQRDLRVPLSEQDALRIDAHDGALELFWIRDIVLITIGEVLALDANICC